MAWERGDVAPMARRRERRQRRCRRVEGGRRRGGGTRPGGRARPAWPLGAGWAGSACLAARPKRSGGLAGSEAKRAAGSAGPKIRKKEISELKLDFLNLPRLWKFVEGDLGGILT
jgi:hypothetical protein